MKNLVKNKTNMRDLISIILIVNNLEHGRVSTEGNEYLKSIEEIQDLYTFFVLYLPEQVVSTFIPKKQLEGLSSHSERSAKILNEKVAKKRDKKKAEKMDDEEGYDDEEEATEVTVENRTFIVKYLLLFASVYSKITDKESLVVDIDSLVTLMSVIHTERLKVKAMSLLIASLSNETLAQTLSVKYVKQNCMNNPLCIDTTLNVMVALISYSEINDKFIQTLTTEILDLAAKLSYKTFTVSCFNFIKGVCKRFKMKLYRARTDVSEKIINEIVSNNYLNIAKYLFNFTRSLQNDRHQYNLVHESYELILNLLSETLSFMGTEITIYTAFTLKVIRLYHKVLYVCCEYLGEKDKTCTNPISSFVMCMLEKNDAFFCKNQDKSKKDKAKEGEEAKHEKEASNGNKYSVVLTQRELNHPSLPNKYFQEILNALKISMALYYNSGRNIGFPDFAICTTARLRRLQAHYAELIETIKLKNATAEKKDQRNQIYQSREKKIVKLIDDIQKASKYSIDIRNQYVNSVTIDTHQVSKMIDYCNMGVAKEQPSLYKESVNMIKV